MSEATSLTERPPWCPHPDCQIKQHFQHLMCVGKLPKPEPHGGDENTHRLCLDTRETHHEVFDLQLNHTDAYLLRILLNLVEK